jgi:ATP-dependent DNA ligase
MMIKPIAPMLAVPMAKADIRDWNDYVAEEKYDGWRLVVTIPADDPIVAHTRLRKHSSGSKDQNDVTGMLPVALLNELHSLRPRTGVLVLDGELLAVFPDGRIGTSTDVPRKELAKRYVVFDVLMTPAGSSMMFDYAKRRAILNALLCVVKDSDVRQHVVAAEVRDCIDTETVSAFTHEVWDRGGEGLILKRKDARYEAGKRREAFVKIKKLFTAVIKVTGFEATRGTVLNRGDYAKVCGVIVEAPKGHEALLGTETSVKTKNDEELAAFNKAKGAGTLGRLLRIEYQDIAAEGGVRHPRWDRWENE